MTDSPSSVILPPTATTLTTAWDIDRFIVLGSCERLVAVMYCPFLQQIETGVRPASSSAGAKGSNNNKNYNQQQQAAFMIEAAFMVDALRRISRNVSRYCTIYFADTDKVHDYDSMYELLADEPFALLFYYRNKHVKLNLGTGNYHKINFQMSEDDLREVIEAAFIGAKKGDVVVDTRKSFDEFAGRGMP